MAQATLVHIRNSLANLGEHPPADSAPHHRDLIGNEVEKIATSAELVENGPDCLVKVHSDVSDLHMGQLRSSSEFNNAGVASTDILGDLQFLVEHVDLPLACEHLEDEAVHWAGLGLVKLVLAKSNEFWVLHVGAF